MSAIHNLPHKDQQELMANISKTFMKPPIVITQGAPQFNNNTGRIYQVDEEEEEEVFVATELDRIFLGGAQDYTSVADPGFLSQITDASMTPTKTSMTLKTSRRVTLTLKMNNLNHRHELT